MGHFSRINQQIENASRKFLADIESWRKKHFHELKQLVDEFGIEEPEEWLDKLEKWAKTCDLWPSESDPQHRLKRSPAHWQMRAFIWTTRLKIDLTRLIHDRTSLSRQQLELYREIGLRYSSTLPNTIENIQTLNLKLHKLNITCPRTYREAMDIRAQIDQLIGSLTEDVLKTEKPLDLLMSDQSKREQTNKLLKLRSEIDDNSSTLSLVRRYLDWASQEPYIAEVIKYLDKTDAIMTHCVNQVRKHKKQQEES